MKGSEDRIVELLDGAKKHFIIPVYQRNYSWKKDHCKQLYDDLVRIVKEDKATHFFGSIVSSSVSINDIIIIDGQQRITTISILIIAIINAIKNGEITTDNETLVEELETEYIVNKFNKDENKIKLRPFRNDSEAYKKIIYSTESEYIENSPVTINYRYFYNRLLENEVSVDDLYQAIQKLTIINIELGKDDDAQLIFESLNSTGMDLSEADKIRNFILMRVDTEKQEKYYDTYWNKIETYTGSDIDLFVRDYLTIETKNIANLKKLYFAFKEYANQQSDPKVMLSKMLGYAEIYRDMRAGKVGTTLSNRIMNHLNLLEASYADTFIMTLVNKYKNGELSKDELERILHVIEVYVFRRMMCDMPSNALGKIFPILDKRIESLKGDTGAKYSDVLIYQLESYSQTGSFPKDDVFKEGFIKKDCYHMRKICRMYLFDRLENQDSKEVNDVVSNMEENNYTVEHIMPQTLTPHWKEVLGEESERIHDEWQHTIANLTLTAYNSEYSNLPFSRKKTVDNGFEASGLRLNQALLKYEQWTETEMKARQKDLLDIAMKLWPYPETTFEPEQKEGMEVTLADDTNFANTKLNSITLNDVVFKDTDWAKAFVRLYKYLYDQDPSILQNAAKNSDIVWFSDTEKNTTYKEIGKGVYYCTLSDTNSKFRVFKQIIEKYDIDKEDVVVSLTNVISKE
ncbi:MAG: DUF262 domain-containing HNH endonuclease family protein [Bacteroidaceae bacterium]|nr:DUF262 domain-containing HNH endonuclease family protein [Bacteroidaceae bacterium]